MGKVATRNLAFSTTFLCMVVVSLPASFFPSYVAAKYGASESTIGFIFACYPAAQVISSPFWTLASECLPRSWRLCLGLTLFGYGSVLFALGDSIVAFMIARSIQGVAAQVLNSVSLALVMQVSDNIQRDIGIEEFIVGVGYMVGPALGGCLYQYVGFQWAILPIPIICLCLMACIPCVGLMGQSDGRGTYSMLPSTSETEDTEVEGKLAEQSWRDCMTLEVGIMTLVAVVHAACQSFCDMTLARHLFLALGANAALSGAVFMVEPILYSAACFGVGSITSMSRKLQITTGLLVYALGYWMIGTPQFFAEHPEGTAWSMALSPSGEWCVVICGLILMGISSALVAVPVVPAMMFSVSNNSKGVRGEASTPSVSEQVEDTISGIYNSSWSVGELVGPPIGGFLLEHLPKSYEINCKLPAKDCTWAYQNANTVFTILITAFAGGLVLILRKRELCDFKTRGQESLVGDVGHSDL